MASGANPGRVPGTNPTPPGSIRSSADITLGLRLIQEAARAGTPDSALGANLMACRLLGVGVATAITSLQRAGRLPACGTQEWARLVDLAEHGQVSIAPVILIGDRDYACPDIVEERLKGPAEWAPPPVVSAAQPGAATLADEIASWGRN